MQMYIPQQSEMRTDIIRAVHEELAHPCRDHEDIPGSPS